MKKEHAGLWIEPSDNGYLIGLTKEKQDELGEVTFVSLPKVDDVITAEQPFLEVEAEKAVSEFRSPVSGKVLSVNDAAITTPKVLNDADPKVSWILALTDVSDDEFAKL